MNRFSPLALFVVASFALALGACTLQLEVLGGADDAGTGHTGGGGPSCLPLDAGIDLLLDSGAPLDAGIELPLDAGLGPEDAGIVPPLDASLGLDARI